MSDSQQPVSSSFDYLLVPADDKLPVQSFRFDGGDDQALRDRITSYFRQGATLSLGQREELKSNILQRAAANAAKNAVKSAPANNNEDEGTAVTTTTSPSTAEDEQPQQPNSGGNNNMHALADDFVDHSSFEIVPIVMPTRKNHFVGTSLYIDDAGRFKELGVNSRASTIAQRDIRGDAFLLSNYDDPAADDWRRIDTTMETYDHLLKNPPQAQVNVDDQAAMAHETLRRENEAKKISMEDAKLAVEAKAEGNQLFAAGDVNAAINAYSHAIELLDGRRDLHNNADELELTLRSSHLNRSLCYGKAGQWNNALLDARMAVELDPGNAKAYFRVATARHALNEFAEALDALKACEMSCGPSEEIERLRKEIGESRRAFQSKQKAAFSKMFQ